MSPGTTRRWRWIGGNTSHQFVLTLKIHLYSRQIHSIVTNWAEQSPFFCLTRGLSFSNERPTSRLLRLNSPSTSPSRPISFSLFSASSFSHSALNSPLYLDLIQLPSKPLKETPMSTFLSKRRKNELKGSAKTTSEFVVCTVNNVRPRLSLLHSLP